MTSTFALTSTYVICRRHGSHDTRRRRHLLASARRAGPEPGTSRRRMARLLVRAAEVVAQLGHPHGDEIVHCSSGQRTLLLQTPEGVEAVRLSQGKTVIIPGAPGTPPGLAPGPNSRTSPVGWHDLQARPRPQRVTQPSIQKEAL
jgi:hypothetical protein